MHQRTSLLLILAACGSNEIPTEGGPYGSQALVAAEDGRTVYAVDPIEGTVAAVNLDTGAVLERALAGEPTRIARAHGRLFVTLRNARAVEVLDPTLASLGDIPTSAEPFGIVALGDRVYVAAALGEEIIEIDARALVPLRRWWVPGEPRWLAIHPSGSTLYVASARDGAAYTIDLAAGRSAAQPIALPERLSGYDLGSERIRFVRRLSGDPTVTPDGQELLLPGYFADNVTPILDFTEGDYYYSVHTNLEPSIVVVALDAGGQPRTDQTAVIGVYSGAASGYPAAAVVSPTGDALLVPLETGHAIVVADPRPEASVAERRAPNDGTRWSLFEGTAHVGFDPRPVRGLHVDAGPTAAAFISPDEAVVYCFLDRTLVRVAPAEWMPSKESLGMRELELSSAEPGLEVAPSRLAPELAAGLRSFYEGVDPRVTSNGLSCALCHFGGRDDGITWTFAKGLRQTPSLAGELALTAPYRWQGERATVRENAIFTSRGMSGGAGLTESEADQVSDFLDTVPSPDTRRRGSLDAGVQRGDELFHRPDVGCAGCHGGPALTDNGFHDMLGLEGAQTPSLVGVSASAPYFHDGSVATLHGVLELSRSGVMGDTSRLSEAELSDLESYLESL